MWFLGSNCCIQELSQPSPSKGAQLESSVTLRHLVLVQDALCPCLARGTAAVAPGQRCACLQPAARGVRVPQAGTSGGGQVQTLRPAEEVIWGPAVEKLSVCD